MTDEPIFPLQGHLGMELDVPEPGVGTAELEVGEAHLNPNGVVHGAVLFALVDTAMGAATLGSLAPGLICASIEVHLRFLGSVREGRLAARAWVVRGGSRVVHVEGRIVTGEDRLVATATGSFAVLPAPAGG